MATIVQCPYCPAPHKNGVCGECGVDLRKGPAGCKHCPGNLKPGDIVCLKCGMNLLTGQRIAQAREERRNREVPWTSIAIAIGVVVFTAICAGIGYWIFTRNPVDEARRLAATGHNIEALNALAPFLKKHDKDVAAHTLQGKIHYQMSDFAAALGDFESAASLAPKDEDIALLAAASAGQLPGDSGAPRQVAAFRRLVDIQPNNGRYHYLLGMALGASGDITGQVQELERAVALGAQEVPARLHLAAAKALHGEAAAASQDLGTVTGAPAPDLAVVQAAVSGLQGQADAKLWESAMNGHTDAENPVRLRLGATYLSQGQYELALDTLRPAAKAKTGADTAAQFLYALGLQGLKQDTEASAIFDSIAEGKTPWVSAACLQMAEIMLAQNNLPRANEYLRRAGDKDKTARALTLEGRVRVGEQQLDQADEAFRKAIAADPNYAPAYLENGLMLVARNELDRGVHELDEYLRLARAHGDLPQLNEVELLVNQLKQSAPGAAPPANTKEAAAQ